jgi:predicted DNA-binding protein with PD1-like motif
MQYKDQEKESFPVGFWKEHQGEIRTRAVAGKAGRIVAGRLRPGTDLIPGILELAQEHGVKTGLVTAFGSLAQARFSEGVQPSAGDPERVERIPPRTVPGPLEFICGQGKIGFPEDKEPVVHFHGLFVTPEGRLMGGHFFPGDNPVWATFEVIIQEILGVAFDWQRDPEPEIQIMEALPSS